MIGSRLKQNGTIKRRSRTKAKARREGADLTLLARDKPCMIRIPGYCCHDPHTTVLCHYGLAGMSGGAFKAPDTCGAWGCNVCHDIVDERKRDHPFTEDEIHRMFAEGVLRTLDELQRLGYHMTKAIA
jgi:hypothetical protein